ncbi:MAG: glycosyltransferase family 2 protein [Candidatus Scalindua sp.]|jgi:GT2 family glycosyltransferase|nr:glycosyltransferase family 2 protein [Candidatus Scalindua sp.]
MTIVSILIVTWNSAEHLPRSLDSLKNQSYKDLEVILVDNGSADGCIDGIKEKYPELDILLKKLDKNAGFAVANNIGARMARGKWLALLNADAFPESDWLENLLEAAKQYPNAFFASQQIQANTPDLLDGEGDIYHISGLAWRRNYGYPLRTKAETEEIFSPCAAAALYPRRAFLDVGGFDEDYFAYHEDVDLSFRLRLHGLDAYYVPRATVHHIGSASTGKLSDFSVYHGHRNLVWTYFKNMPSPLFWLYLPLHLLINLYFLLSFSVKGRGKVIWQAKIDAIKMLREMWRKRKKIQTNRIASIGDINQALERNFFRPLKVSFQRRRAKTE